MDTRITKFINLMVDNSIIIKSYDKMAISDSGDYLGGYAFNEDLLITTQEISNEEILGFIEFSYNGNSLEITYERFENLQFELNDQTYFKDIEVNHCRFKDFSKTLEIGFGEFKQALASNYNELEQTFLHEITNELKYSRSQLELFIDANRENKLRSINQFMSAKIDFCDEAIRFLDYSTFIFTTHSVVKKDIEEVRPNLAEVKLPKPKKQLENLTSLTQNQVVILFHYLRQLGFVGKEMPKNVYAQHISELTGFAKEKIRQNLSHIDKESQSLESVLFTEADYSVIRRAMDKLISTLKTDSEEKFS